MNEGKLGNRNQGRRHLGARRRLSVSAHDKIAGDVRLWLAGDCQSSGALSHSSRHSQGARIQSQRKQPNGICGENARRAWDRDCGVPSPEDAVRGVDFICEASSARSPVFDGELLRPGQHMVSVGGGDERFS